MKYITSNNPYFTSIGFMILNSLQKSKIGILNYKKTYDKDIMFSSKIETLLESFEVKYCSITKSFRGE